ncbi:hypothetical protein QBC34DRAFT_474288 [Podospora aff. communis PSN243]|uniref:Nucleoside phosphorylase domain-containing protein n=1 Tax=Podospora aff. communis PSN243 TaxID=3040156 RepID=A0AAV9G8S4_9PEZI|nr:hypothetical protein QBC34DRAFT_474288 [Podospora aff. communis PSN243]
MDPKRARLDVGLSASNPRRLGGSLLVHRDYEIAWICALPLELAQSRAMLDLEHSPLPNEVGDDNVYVLGAIGQHNVVMTCLPGQYGTNNAAIVATNLRRSFPHIRATLMVGIGGGCPSQADIYLGDVVVGTRVMQYDMGKTLGSGHFQGTAIPKTPAPLLNSAVSSLRSKFGPHQPGNPITGLLRSRLPNLSRPDHPDRLFKASYDHPPGAPTCDDCNMEQLQPRAQRLSEEPKIHYGVIASGNSVMRNGLERDRIAMEYSALCFEMEAAGMMDNVQCLPIRGICDYSDSHKDKFWQDYAAATAAAYARELLKVLPRSSGPPKRTAHIANAWQRDGIDDRLTAEQVLLIRRKDLMKSLDFPEIGARKANISATHAKTCRWLLGHSKYQDWLDTTNNSRHSGFLWMRGKAGAGKSTMMKFLYLESKMKDGPNSLTASFFFNARGVYLERSIVGMYRSLLRGLLLRFPDLQSALDGIDIVPMHEQGCPGLNALQDVFMSAVMRLHQRSFTCFIDALDECDEQEARAMVQFFEDLAENATGAGINLRICFSSRPYPYISIRRGILLSLDDEDGHTQDLAQYVESKLRIDDARLLTDLQRKIVRKSSGVFLWISLTVDILNEETDNGGLALETRLSQIPEKLSDLFRSMLTRDQKLPERLLACILWILCAKRPLTPAEFRHAMWVALLHQQSTQNDCDLVDSNVPDVENTNSNAILVTSSSKGLAEVSNSDPPTVQFIHESVRDFLVKDRGLQELWPDVGFQWEALGHEKLRSWCSQYLSLGKPRATSKSEDAWDAQKYLLSEYAAENLLHHTDAATLVIPQDEFISRLFTLPATELAGGWELWSHHVRPTLPYFLAEQGLANLIAIWMKQDSAKQESFAYVPEGKFRYALFAALALGHTDAAAALLRLSPGDIDTTTRYVRGPESNDRFKCETPLSWACVHGEMTIAKALIRLGADVNEVREIDGMTPLMLAAMDGHEALVKLLIDSGADVHVRDGDGSTALMLATMYGHKAVVRLLTSRGWGLMGMRVGRWMGYLQRYKAAGRSG